MSKAVLELENRDWKREKSKTPPLQTPQAWATRRHPANPSNN